ncbi:DUF7310 family coiled-coil domain-containing protein [Halopiger djelfimassiliensis]|uniref:DUF7310 family coiled-coil domain-containing protein n=1 Tax=Halopiger djelfimassiliensis TaxID=1293047 RepID=UPI000677C0E0|nr:hypothetical protein [Halopiger djelfimassiliensis]
MTDIDRLDQRLSAVERVVVDGDVTLDELTELTSVVETVSELEARVDEQEQRIADLEAAVQSIEGYVGNVESINDDVEQQAASAIATVDRLERRIEALEVEIDDLKGGILEDELTDDADADGGTGNTEMGTEEKGAVFEYESTNNEELTPEQSVKEIVDSDTESRSIVDDGMDRPVSSASQETVDSALGGEDESEGKQKRASAQTDNTNGQDENGDGLFGSLRSRLS